MLQPAAQPELTRLLIGSHIEELGPTLPWKALITAELHLERQTGGPLLPPLLLPPLFVKLLHTGAGLFALKKVLEASVKRLLKVLAVPQVLDTKKLCIDA